MAAPGIGLRAARGYIVGKRRDKAGRVVKVRNHVVTGAGGLLSAKEMEREMMKVADAVGADHRDIRIEYYKSGAAPIEVGRDRPAQRRIGANSEIPAGDVNAFKANFDRAFGKKE